MTEKEVKDKVLSKFKTSDVLVLDQTGIGNNFKIIFNKANFNLSRLEVHRSVMRIFADELKNGSMHALSIDIKK